MRFSESQHGNTAQLDFVPRERRAQIMQVIVACAVAIALIFVLSFIAAQKSSLLSALGSVLVIAVLGFYIVYRKQQNLDLVMTTEYQNMLFAQAASLGSTLCLFVRRDGTIVYANDGLRTMFPSASYGEAQTLEAIFDQGGVAKTDRERVMAAVYGSTSDRVVFPIKQPDGSMQDYILTLQPMTRPAGFMVIRAREYKDTRAGTQMLPDILRSTSADRLEHLLSRTPVAHYVTDTFGRFEYVNPAFETMLGYSGGEILTAKIGIQHVLYQLAGQPTGEDYTLADFRGEALLQKRNGELASVLLHQAILRDGSGKTAGATGSVLPIAGR